MNPAEAVALLHRASHDEHGIAGTLTVHQVAEVQRRLSRQAMEQAAETAMGPAAARFAHFFGGIHTDDDSVPADRPDARDAFQVAPGRTVVGDEPSGLDELLRPGWLIAGFDLSLASEDPDGRVLDGRAAVALVAHPRPVAAPRGPIDDKARLSRVEVLVDRELGILLRSAEYFEDELCRTAELTGLVLDPAPPAEHGAVPEEDADEDLFAGLTDAVPAPVRLIARGIGAALGEAVRISARINPVAEPDDGEPWFEQEPGPEPEPMAAEPEDRAALSQDDALALLLHRSGRGTPPFTAEVHVWVSSRAYLDAGGSLRAPVPFLGPEAVWSAIGDSTPDRSHRVYRLAFADLLHYRLDTVLDGRGKEPTAVSCDGATGYRLFPDRLVTVPAAPPEFATGQLLDLSWLLCHDLTVLGPAEYGGRAALRVGVVPRPHGAGLRTAFFLLDRLELLVDTELGVGLRLTVFRDGDAVARQELRGVEVNGAAEAAGAGATGFALVAPPGGRTHQGGGPFGDSALPTPLKAAAGAAGALVGGAALFAGLFGRKPQPSPEPSPEPPAGPSAEA